MTYNAFLRDCCYKCQFRKNHCSDITIADFWGYREIDDSLNDEKVLSLLISNTYAGGNAIKNMHGFDLHEIDNKYSEYVYSVRDYSDAYKLKKKFFKIYYHMGFEKAANKTYMKGIWKTKIKYYIKKMMGRE